MNSHVNIELDGQSLALGSEMSFEDASQQIKNQISPQRVLTEIYIDKKSIDMDEELRISNLPLGKLGSIRFVSKKVEDLLRESSQVAVSVCDAMKFECSDIEKFIESNQMQEAHQRIAELGSLLDWMLQLLASLRSYGSDSFGSYSISSGEVKDVIKGMEISLTQLNQHMAKSDFDSFLQVLRGDFQTQIQNWREVFNLVSTSWTPRPLKSDSLNS